MGIASAMRVTGIFHENSTTYRMRKRKSAGVACSQPIVRGNRPKVRLPIELIRIGLYMTGDQVFILELRAHPRERSAICKPSEVIDGHSSATYRQESCLHLLRLKQVVDAPR